MYISFYTAISILVISNHNSLFPSAVLSNCFRIFYLKNIFIFQDWKRPAEGTGTVPIVSAHFRSVRENTVSLTKAEIAYVHNDNAVALSPQKDRDTVTGNKCRKSRIKFWGGF